MPKYEGNIAREPQQLKHWL